MHLLNLSNFYNEKKLKTRMHSSRMITACFSCHLGECLPKVGWGEGRILNGFGFGFRVPVAGFGDQVNLKCVLGGSLPGEGVFA